MQGKGYGMPSSHAQFVAYFSCYITLFLLLRHKPNFSVTPNATTLFQRVAISFLAFVGASAVAISRLYLNYHTKKQVLVGCSAGVLFSIIWFFAITFLRASGWIDWALDLSLLRALRVRDLVVSEDLTEAGWQRWEARRKLKRREDSKISRKSK
jgi:dolichyldiphosphatase